MSPALGWIVLVVGLVILRRDPVARATTSQSRSDGAAHGVTLLTIAAAAVAGVVLVGHLQHQRGTALAGCRGWSRSSLVILMVLHVPAAARGSAATSSRSAPTRRRLAAPASTSSMVQDARLRVAGVVAGFAGMVYASNLGVDLDRLRRRQIVLYAVAAAVIGGASLFGGRAGR